jgi:hypothetical protein
LTHPGGCQGVWNGRTPLDGESARNLIEQKNGQKSGLAALFLGRRDRAVQPLARQVLSE